jgi:hypothetical protein
MDFTPTLAEQAYNDVFDHLADMQRERNIENTTEPEFYQVFGEPIGRWLVQLHRRMNDLVHIEECLGERWKRNVTNIGGAYFLALDHMLQQAATGEMGVTSTEVLWEVYRWQKLAYEDNPDRIPLTLNVEFWPQMSTIITLAIMDNSIPYVPNTTQFPENQQLYNMDTSVQMNVAVEPQGDGEGVDTSRLDALAEAAAMARDEMDYDSDTDIEARVSPEYPLSSGDMIEDEEMYARIGFASDYAADRSAFTTVLCDNM